MDSRPKNGVAYLAASHCTGLTVVTPVVDLLFVSTLFLLLARGRDATPLFPRWFYACSCC